MKSNRYFQTITAFVVGLIFAAGLAVSGMTQPHKVIGFLQIGRDWDPTLIFVMVGAIAVHMLAYRFVRARKTPLLDSRFHLPTSKDITKPLIIGSGIFGFGWALGGYCPGPGIASLGAGSKDAILFVVFMIVGMVLQRVWQSKFAK